ncbi:DUF2158 domain-containing protein [Maribacter sp. 2304DJ31-5]|uniref:DUF2158 domain-containing protein n=1 Tax=Maribacter sp. 2304DJ31-5 TaxID=3386273 RepID=UPI0039BC6573
MKAIDISDTVRLTTGGPKMKVTAIESDEYVNCSWVNNRNDEMFGSFPKHLLNKIKL